MGKFDEDGYELSGIKKRKGQLTITKGALVVAKGELKDGQYQLIRKIVVGEAGVASVYQSR